VQDLDSVHPKKHNAMQSYKEIWKDVPNYEGHYQVSNLGRVKSLKSGKDKILKPKGNGRGYLQVGLRKEGERKFFLIHRLVMLLFVGESDLEVNHKNGIKADNRLENLEYCTRSENMTHAYSIGLKKVLKGEKNYASKLTEIEVKMIKYEHKNMTQKEIANIYGVTDSMVGYIRSGKNWKHI
jgi:hypothetical protein